MRKLMTIILTLAALGTLLSVAPAVALSVKTGDAFPWLTVADENGKAVELKKVINGRPAVVVYWSVTCHVCVDDVPRIMNHYNGLKKKAYRLVLVAGESSEMVPVAKCFIQAKKPGRAVVLFDRLTKKGHVLANTLGLEFTPTVIIIDRRGKIVQVFEGAPNLKKLDAAVAKALK
ncbi:MAG: TlpA family protein disulfide reductase [Proteobacteria bacterium]|nr:TlpA family protein disulfide reductase [Pseudomonadota bacterium]